MLGPGEMEHNFQKHAISYEQLCDNPLLVRNPNLVVRVNDNYFNWDVSHTGINALRCKSQPCMLVGRWTAASVSGCVWQGHERQRLWYGARLTAQILLT